MKKITIMALFGLLMVFTFSCGIGMTRATGTDEEAIAYICAEIHDDVTAFEWIHDEIVPERTDENRLVVDGTLFYDGKDDVIPEHVVRTGRAFSGKLDSYVFLIFDTYAGTYRMVQNYDVAEEKQDARMLSSLLREMLDDDDIPTLLLKYQKFDLEATDLDEVYRLSASYEFTSHSLDSPLWILIDVDVSANRIRAVKERIQEKVDSMGTSMSVEIRTCDDRTITFYKYGQPLIDGGETGGLQSSF